MGSTLTCFGQTIIDNYRNRHTLQTPRCRAGMADSLVQFIVLGGTFVGASRVRAGLSSTALNSLCFRHGSRAGWLIAEGAGHTADSASTTGLLDDGLLAT